MMAMISGHMGCIINGKKQPDHLIVQDESGYESDYYATDLADALRIRDSKIIRDY